MRRTFPALLLVFALALALAAPVRGAEARGPALQPFSDVPEDAWYHDAVLWGADQGITDGADDGRFLPGQPCARQQVTAFLHRYAGEPKPETELVFSDVPGTSIFRDSILWCAGRGITDGAAEGFFDPRGTCTRAQIVTFLYRFARSEGKDVTPGEEDLSAFSDAGRIPAYAAEPFRWAVSAGLVNGTGGGLLSPEAPCTRAQILTMLYRWNWREEGFVEKAVSVYRESLNETETAILRYYSDLPDVPYMGMLAFYEQFMLGGMDLVWTGDVCTLTQADSTAAVVDTAADTLDCTNLSLFTYLPDYKEGPVTSSATIAPFLETDSVTADRPAAPSHLDFGSYGIDLRGGPDDVYFPLATLSDLFAGYENYRVAFNGKNLYAADSGRLLYTSSAMEADPDYYTPILDRRIRPEDLADFTYRELCFNIDTFYGLPGSAPLNDALAEQGLDSALQEANPDLIPRLRSTDLTVYAAGLQRLLGFHLDDKGHTFFTGIQALLEAKDQDELVRSLILQLLRSEALETSPADKIRKNSLEAAQAARTAAFGSETFVTAGDTALLVLDSFNVDYPGWAAYYDGGPMPEDALGRLKRALDRAEADPRIDTFVLDLTCNGGGDTNALFAMESLLLGRAEEQLEDRLTGQTVTQTYRVDRNLDRVFDAGDDQVRYHLNLAVLTSVCSFSCANILASDCRDAGIMLLGEGTGGGACPIQENVTADGLPYRLSSFLRVLNRGGEVIDEGILPDADLLITRQVIHEDKAGIETIVKDYSGFYDLAALSRLVHAFYEAGAAA